MIPLIAPKPFTEYTPDEYHAYVCSMWALPKAKGKPRGPVGGVSVSRLKSGKLSLRRTKQRSFAYLTHTELRLLAEHHKTTQSELFQVAKSKQWIIAPDRMSAEKVYADINDLPF